MQAFVADTGSCSILKGCQFNFKYTYLAYHHSSEVNWEDEYCVEWLPYISSSSDLLDIRAGQIIAGKKEATNLQARK